MLYDHLASLTPSLIKKISISEDDEFFSAEIWTEGGSYFTCDSSYMFSSKQLDRKYFCATNGGDYHNDNGASWCKYHELPGVIFHEVFMEGCQSIVCIDIEANRNHLMQLAEMSKYRDENCVVTRAADGLSDSDTE